jgi:hypothetical protein
MDQVLKYQVSGAAVLRVAHARGDVAQPVADQPHAKSGRRLADRADADLLIRQYLPDLLRVLVAAFDLQAGSLAEQVPHFQDVRIIRLGALRAAGGIVGRIVRSHVRLCRVDRDSVAREQVQ